MSIAAISRSSLKLKMHAASFGEDIAMSVGRAVAYNAASRRMIGSDAPPSRSSINSSYKFGLVMHHKTVLNGGAGNFLSSGVRGFHTTQSGAPAVGLSQIEYSRVADLTMDAIYEVLDEVAEQQPGSDVEFSSGVLSFSSSVGTYVINKQPPSRQIWLSSPVSGPMQFSYDRPLKGWRDIRGSGETLAGILNKELGVELDISD